ncbi:MAG: hypothetical protein WD557_01245 [Dehalococcoidia bacterium]
MIRYTYDVEEIYRRLEVFHGISRATASERLHRIKRSASLPPDFATCFDLTGNAYSSEGGDWLGSLTVGGAP